MTRETYALPKDRREKEPYEQWAKEAAADFERGYLDCCRGVEFTPFSSTYWNRGYQSAVEIFAGVDGEKEFRRIRGY